MWAAHLEKIQFVLKFSVGVTLPLNWPPGGGGGGMKCIWITKESRPSNDAIQW